MPLSYDFIDIGCGCFDTSVDFFGMEARGILVEPIKVYYDLLPSSNTVVKENVAIGDFNGTATMKHYPVRVDRYHSHDDMKQIFTNDKYKFSNIIASGCSSFDNRILPEEFEPVDRIVDVIPLSDLIEKYDVGDVRQIKIDTEGDEQKVLEQLIELMYNGLVVKEKIIFEYCRNLSSLFKLSETICKQFNFSAKYSKKDWNEDMILTKEKSND